MALFFQTVKQRLPALWNMSFHCIRTFLQPHVHNGTDSTLHSLACALMMSKPAETLAIAPPTLSPSCQSSTCVVSVQHGGRLIDTPKLLLLYYYYINIAEWGLIYLVKLPGKLKLHTHTHIPLPHLLSPYQLPGNVLLCVALGWWRTWNVRRYALFGQKQFISLSEQ